MIICAALLVENKLTNKLITIPCYRHGVELALLAEFNQNKTYKVIEQGFIDNHGNFLNRKEAFNNALNCGQLSTTTLWYKEDHNQNELYSEDLY